MGTPRVLLVLPDGDRERVVSAFRATDVAVTETTGVEGALDALANETVDCVVSEFYLQSGDGLDLLSAIRERDLDVPFVLYTDAGSAELGDRAITADVTEYVHRDGRDPSTVLPGVVDDVVGDVDPDGPSEPGLDLERYRTIVDAIGDPVYVLDADERIRYVNRATAELTGFDRAELIGAHVSTVLTAEDVDRGRAVVADLLADDDRRTATLSMAVTTTDGECVPVENHLALVPYDDESRGIAGVLRDVSEHRARERELEQYETIVETVPEGVYVIDEAANVVGGNVRGAEMLGLPYEEAVSLSIPDLIDRGIFEEGVVEPYQEAVARLLSSDDDLEEATLEIRVTPDGETEERTYETTLTLRPFDDEFRGVIGVVRDVTDRKRRRRELQRYETILEAIGDPVYTLDENGMVTYGNEATFEKFGYPEEELIGTSVAGAMDAEDLGRAVELIGEMVEDPTVDSVTLEYEMTASDGSRIPVENKLTLLPTDEDETFRGTAGVLRDVTERRQRERRLQVLNRVLRHNIRNEMAIVGGYAEQLESQVPNDRGTAIAEDIRERAMSIARMGDETRRLERAIDRSLDDVRPVEAVDYVQQVVQAYAQTYPQAEVLTNLPDSAVVAADDPLRPAIANVVENAIVHNDRENPTVWVSIVPDEDLPEDRLVIRVADDGPGIPEKERKLVTGKLESSPLEHGNGFGLWVTTWIVESFGGTVSFRRREPRGTVADLHLRRMGDEETDGF